VSTSLLIENTIGLDVWYKRITYAIAFWKITIMAVPETIKSFETSMVSNI